VSVCSSFVTFEVWSDNYPSKLVRKSAVCGLISDIRIKLSPCGGYNDMYFTTHESTLETFKYYITQLDALNIAWMQITQYNAYGDAKLDGKPQGYDHDVVATYGPLVKNSNFLANCGYTAETGEEELKNKDRNVKGMVYGSAWIANPDLYMRFQEKVELSQPDHTVCSYIPALVGTNLRGGKLMNLIDFLQYQG